MNLILTLILISLAFLVFALSASMKLHKLKKKSVQVISALDDMQNGNLNRRILATNNDFMDEICYKINRIAQAYTEQLSQFALIEKTNKQIMTSLSHDIRTPLTPLIGYLDAIQSGAVCGEEREHYIEIAQSKAYAIKTYTDDLFEWCKINSNEKLYQFEATDINELSRNIIIDWIPQFEKIGLDYEVDISDNKFEIYLDTTAYKRILNNLIYNAMEHSNGTYIRFVIREFEDSALIIVSDNGKGITEKDLPYVFERLYKCDEARPIGSSGLGLSIVHELVKSHGGTVSVESTLGVETSFLINMKKTRLQ